MEEPAAASIMASAITGEKLLIGFGLGVRELLSGHQRENHHGAPAVFDLGAPETIGKVHPSGLGRPGLVPATTVESGHQVSARYFAPDARQRPGKTPFRTALSPRLLIRMRSPVQVLAGPLHRG
jgi:hypothetical protein